MSDLSTTTPHVPWWREPTREQWHAYSAVWLGWMLDAFDFTIFLAIMVPIAHEFDVPLAAVAAVFSVTFWLRLLGAIGAGWLADRIGRKAPLTISILWYSVCCFLCGLAPSFAFLFFFRAILGLGMGAEWSTGNALAMESWPARSRGVMSSMLAGAWGVGFALSSSAYALLYHSIGWRGLLMLGLAPAVIAIWARVSVHEPEVWKANRAQQRAEGREVHVPLLALFRRGMLPNTVTACLWMVGNGCAYYSIWALWQTYLKTELHWTPGDVWWSAFWGNITMVIGCVSWGFLGDAKGRRWAIIVPAGIGLLVTPIYLLSTDFLTVTVFFIIQGLFAGSMYSQNSALLSERFPTEIRATAMGFVAHFGTMIGGMTAPILTLFATGQAVSLPSWLGGATLFEPDAMGFAMPMLWSTTFFICLVIVMVVFGPETRGRELNAQVTVR